LDEVKEKRKKKEDKEGTYVRAQPNIDDLICAGMSSGPGIRTEPL
jgi:hypothetical protein